MTQQYAFTAPSFATWDASSGAENLPPFPSKGGKLYPARLLIAENCRFTENGGVQIRLGAQNKGSLGTGVKIDSIQGFETGNFNVMFLKSGTKIFQTQNANENTPLYYDIGVTRTATEKDFFFAKRKDMFAVNQTDSNLRIFTTALLGIDLVNARITIPAGDTNDLSDTGVFFIRGISVSYTKAVTFTAVAVTDILTSVNHGLTNGAVLTVANTGGALPSGLVAGTTYFVINATADTFQLSATSGGAPIDLMSDGTGTNTFIAEDDIIRACIGLTADMATGDILTQTYLLPDNPKGTCMSELQGAALQGGVKADPTDLHYSVQSTGENPEYFYDYDGTGSGSKPMPRDITALLQGTSVTLIGLLKGLVYATDFSSAGALLTTSLSSTHVIPNAKCISQSDEDFMMITGDGRILPIGQTNAGFKVIENTNNPDKDLDYPVQTFIQSYIDKINNTDNFQHYDPGSNEVSTCIQLKTGITTEIIYSKSNHSWSNDTGRSFSCKTIFKGRTFCGSDNSDTVYLQDEGLEDDTIDIGYRIVSGLMNFKNSSVTFEPQGLSIGGLLSAIGQFTVNIYIEGELSCHQVFTAEDLIMKGLMKVTAGEPIGAGQVGAHRIGNGGSAVDVFPFLCPIPVLFECRQIQVEIISTDAIEIRNFNVPMETEGEQIVDTL